MYEFRQTMELAVPHSLAMFMIDHFSIIFQVDANDVQWLTTVESTVGSVLHDVFIGEGGIVANSEGTETIPLL